MTLPTLTLRQLKAELEKFDGSYLDKEVQVWLPGSYIALSNVFFAKSKGKMLIEGNIEPGSALDN